MLQLYAAQIGGAMADGDAAIAALGRPFEAAVGALETIGDAAGRLPEAASAAEVCREITAGSAMLREHLSESVAALQFYDRLSQRLEHVREGLEALAGLVGDPQRLPDPGQWRQLQARLRSGYTMQEEVEMFDAVFNDVQSTAQLDPGSASRSQPAQAGDVELF